MPSLTRVCACIHDRCYLFLDFAAGWDTELETERILEGKDVRPPRREALALVVPGLKPGRTYSFRVTAFNTSGTSGPGRAAKLAGLGECTRLPPDRLPLVMPAIMPRVVRSRYHGANSIKAHAIFERSFLSQRGVCL